MELERRNFIKAIGGIAGASIFGTTPAAGALIEDDSKCPAYLKDDDLLDNEELEQLLKEIKKEGKHVSVTSLGKSTQGRPIWDITVGRGSTNVMAIAQQHGDELIMPEGTLAGVEFLATSDDPAVQQVRDKLTLHLVPRVNPDGFVAQQRYDVDTDAPEREGASIFGATIGLFAAGRPFIGWDINRYHWADWTDSDLYQNFPDKYPENPVAEARVLTEAVNEKIDPEWIIDYHRQGEYMVAEEATYYPEYPDPSYEEKYPTIEPYPDRYPPDPDDPGGGNIVTSSVFWPANEDVDEDVRDFSKQLAYVMYDELTTDSQANVTWYPGGTYPGISRNAHGLQGRGSVLFELAAGTFGSREYRVQHVAESLLAVAKATADGSVHNADPSNVTDIPGRGSSVVAEGGESNPFPE
jgi:hypothetical protein